MKINCISQQVMAGMRQKQSKRQVNNIPPHLNPVPDGEDFMGGDERRVPSEVI